MDENSPILVGAAQWTGRELDPARAASPSASAVSVACAAAEDAGVKRDALASLDRLGLPSPIGWRAHNAPGYLAEALGAVGARPFMAAVGGEQPLRMLDAFATEIEAGRSRSALLVGTHNFKTIRRARKAGVELDWTEDAAGHPELFGENRPGSSEAEAAVGLDRPSTLYPVFENALRAKRGLDLATHLERVGRMMSAFTRVAARNPYAWFPTERSPAEIITPGPTNRPVAYPYAKYLNSVMETDQAAAVWITSVAEARRLGIPETRWIHYGGGGGAIERAWFTSERPVFGACPALLSSVTQALALAGVELDDVRAFDFYSCFPVAVEMACEMLGLAEDDPRGLTCTGGLPYAGGPGNNYTLHSLAAMVHELRAAAGVGLVTGNGWYLTKHSACVLGTERFGPAHAAPAIDPGPPAREVHADAAGPAEVRAYTVLYDRDGAPVRGIVIGDTDTGERFLANTPEDPAWLEAFVAKEQVGARGRVVSGGATLRFEPE
jgi:acetyl-CoA C-acetyltransferase